MAAEKPNNERIAGMLERIADLLQAQDANPFRIQAYRDGAQSVRDTDRSLAQWIAEQGTEAIQDLPNIGSGLSGLIAEIVHTGRSSLLDRLEGEVSPEAVFEQVPGIGETLARHIDGQLDIDSLEALEQAAHDGRLREVTGFGPRRIASVQLSLDGMLEWQGRPVRGSERPNVGTLLKIDATYREKATAGDLTKIAPRRFNPERKAWLPIWHAERDGWAFTVLYSNTARAHELGTTHDWVVIYYERDGEKGQATVVTQQQGPLQGKRIVRGREMDSRRVYETTKKENGL